MWVKAGCSLCQRLSGGPPEAKVTHWRTPSSGREEKREPFFSESLTGRAGEDEDEEGEEDSDESESATGGAKEGHRRSQE